MGTGISKLPIPPISGDILPLRPPSICKFCWEHPFSVHLGILVPSTPAPRRHPDPEPAGEPAIKGYAYTTSWADLEARAAAGCLWCQFLCVLPRDETSDSPLEITVGRHAVAATTGVTPRGTQNLVVLVRGEMRFRGYVYADANDPASTWIVARSPVLEVGSSHALTLAKTCIDECVHGHERCRSLSQTDTEPPLPTRLIDCSNPDRPRLVPTAGTTGKYVALSYVWGEAQPHKTTTLNISTYERGIDLACFPATIQDAIRVTHALGFRYLWADTLCIIQDSDEDRGREIGRMHDIYRDAHLTIIAASASKVSEGFLQERPSTPCMAPQTPSGSLALPFICPPLPKSNGPDRAVGTIHIAPRHIIGVKGAVQSYSHTSEPISTRGWCMQEYLMSPRALLFTSSTLQFRCPTATHNVGSSFYDQDGERKLPPALFLPDPPPLKRGSVEWGAVRKAWLDIVEDYTRRAITVPSDKLVACGAIAAVFQRVLRSDYLAGLWRDTLLLDMLWHKRAGSDVSRPSAYRAPSWSWVAVDGAVVNGGRWKDATLGEEVPVAEVVRCNVTLADPEFPFGQVTGGSLVLRAAMIPCMLRQAGENTECVLLRPDKPNRTPRSALTGRVRRADAKPKATTGSADVGEAYLDCAADAGIRQAWAVPLVKHGEYSRFWFRQGLLVVPVAQRRGDGSDTSTGEQIVYRRIGFFSIDEEDTGSGEHKAPRFVWIKKLPLVEIELV